MTRSATAPVARAIFAATIAISAASAHAQQFKTVNLGPVVSIVDSGKDVNNSGVVAYTSGTWINLWQSGSSTQLSSYANNGPLAINQAGHLAFSMEGVPHLYRNGVATQLPGLEGPSGTAYDLNDSDVVVGYSRRPSLGRYHACRWDNGVITELPTHRAGGTYAQGDDTRAYAVNNGGVIVGNIEGPGVPETAMKWVNGVGTLLPMPAGRVSSRATALNDVGTAVGFSAGSSGDLKATMWSANSAVVLGALGSHTYSSATAINDQGVVVGFSARFIGDSAQQRAFIWVNGQMMDLNSYAPSPGWTFVEATAISDTGAITGWGRLNGVNRSFALIPVPAPSAVAVVLTGSLAAWCRRRRQRQ
ncbi:MAG TPA: hypothetical protein VD997_16195 [Phycisphaerales bacterium]|nr:hypothetical protein [Phycisphaerales bacterium]